MKSPELTEFFSLLGKAKKEKKEEFDNLLKEAKVNIKKQKKKEEKLIEQLDSIIDVIENPKEVKDITEPAVTVGVPEDFDISSLEEEDPLIVQDWNNGDVKFNSNSDLNFSTTEVFFDFKDQILFGEEKVVGIQNNSRISSEGIKIINKENRIIFTGKSKLLLKK